MWQDGREEPQQPRPSAIPPQAEPAPWPTVPSNALGMMEFPTSIQSEAGRAEAAQFMAHWAEPSPGEAATTEGHPQGAGDHASAPDGHSSPETLWSRIGSMAQGAVGGAMQGTTWLGSKAGELVSGAGSLLSETWDSGKAALFHAGRGLRHAANQEGWLGSLLDPMGALDRQHAQRELGDRFAVVPNEFVGPRLANQVTSREYEEIARTYSDIRLGRGDLTLDASAYSSQQQRDAYQSGALDDIAALMQTRSGRHAIAQLHNNGLRDESGKERSGLFGIPLPWGLGSQIHRHTTVMPLLDGNGMPSKDNGQSIAEGKGDARAILGDGTLGAAGAGVDVRLQYNPRANVGTEYPTLSPLNPWLAEMRSDILLAHEMNHSIRQTQGMVDNRLVRATDNARNRADPATARDAGSLNHLGLPLTRVEHQAVGVGLYADADMTENSYRADRREIADAQGKGLLAGDTTLHQRESYSPRSPSSQSVREPTPAQIPPSESIGQPRPPSKPHGKHPKHTRQ